MQQYKKVAVTVVFRLTDLYLQCDPLATDQILLSISQLLFLLMCLPLLSTHNRTFSCKDQIEMYSFIFFDISKRPERMSHLFEHHCTADKKKKTQMWSVTYNQLWYHLTNYLITECLVVALFSKA